MNKNTTAGKGPHGPSAARQNHGGLRACTVFLLCAAMLSSFLDGLGLSTVFARVDSPRTAGLTAADIPEAEKKAELKDLVLTGGTFVRPASFRGNRTVYWVKPASGALTLSPATFKPEDTVELKVNGVSSTSWSITIDPAAPMTQVEIILTAVVGEGAAAVTKTRLYCLDVCSSDPTSHDVVRAVYGTAAYPDTGARLMALADQIVGAAGFNYSAAAFAFIANNYAGSQKNTNDVNDPARAINPDWRALHYHLSVWNNLNAPIIINNAWSLAEADELRALALTHPGVFMYARNIDTGVVEVVHDTAWGAELMNITDETYFDFLVRSLIHQCRSTGYDSVFLDSYNIDTIYSFTGNRYEGFRGTDLMTVAMPQLGGMTWADASEEFMARLTKELNKAGIWALPNLGNSITTWDPTDYAYANGGMHEGAFIDPDPGASLHDWKQSMSRYMYLSQKQKITIFQYSLDKADITKRMQKIAAYYLVKSDHSYINLLTADGQYAWYPEYDIDLGRPVTTAYVNQDTFSRVADNAVDGYLEGDLYVRRFEKGIVILNPNATARTYAVPSGAAYSRVFISGGGRVSAAGEKQGVLDYIPVSGTLQVTASSAVILVSSMTDSITVRFLKNSDEAPDPAFDSKKVTLSQPYGILPTAYWPGHTFDGWFTDAQGGERILETSIVTIPTDHSLYAHWTRNYRTATYDLMGATGTVPHEQYYAPGAAIILSLGEGVIPPAGYRLTGWSTSPDYLPGTRYDLGASAAFDDDVTLYAILEPIPVSLYTVAYDANGASGTVPAEATFDGAGQATVADAGSMSMPGFSFAGWSTSADGSAKIYLPGETVTAADFAPGSHVLTLYAVWTPVTFRVIYNIMEGTGPTPLDRFFRLGEMVTVARADLIQAPAGYSFYAWYTSTDFLASEVRLAGASYAFTGDTTLYARYLPNSYTVLYVPNGGEGAPPAAQTFSGSSAAVVSGPEGLTRPGFRFAGWNTKPDGTGDAFNPGDPISAADFPAGSTTIELHAVWVQLTCRVTYDIMGCSGTVPPDQVFLPGDTVTLAHGDGITAPAGYRLTGWNTSPDYSGAGYDLGGTAVFGGDVTLYAVLEPVPVSRYSVIYDANGGSGTVPPAETFDETGHATAPDAGSLLRAGFTFSGWNTAADGTGKGYTPGDPITAADFAPGSHELTLYAAWARVTYRVSYNITAGAGAAPADQFFQLGDQVTIAGADGFTPPAGHSFYAWYTSTDYLDSEMCLPGASVAFSGDVTLYARYLPNSYTIVYSPNGAAGAPPAAQTFSGVTGAVVSGPAGLAMTGYRFLSWNSKADGSGKAYSPGVTVGPEDFTPGSTDMVLYAQWALKDLTVTFDKNASDASDPGFASKTVHYGGAYGELPAVSRPGYFFDGWYQDDGVSPARLITATSTVVTDEDHTLHAAWTRSYSVVYDLGGGSYKGQGTVVTRLVRYGDNNLLPDGADFDASKMTRPGYTFAGFDVSAGGTATNVTNDRTYSSLVSGEGTLSVTLKAMWTKAGSPPTGDMARPWVWLALALCALAAALCILASHKRATQPGFSRRS